MNGYQILEMLAEIISGWKQRALAAEMKLAELQKELTKESPPEEDKASGKLN